MSALNEWPTELIEVANGVFAYVQANGGLCISNAGFIVGDDEALIVDTLFTPSMNREFQAQIQRVTSKPANHLINTHHHVDHTLGNALFPESRIISHWKAREEMERFGLPPVLSRIVPHFAAEIEGMTIRLPDISFDGSMEFHFGARRIQLISMGGGHSPGDIVVYLPQERVVFAGDVAFFRVTPAAFDAHISRWIRVVDRLALLDIDVVVPGHGPVGSREDLRPMREYLALLRRHARRAFARGLSAEDAVRSVRLGEYAAWMEPERAFLSIHRLYQEFRGEI